MTLGLDMMFSMPRVLTKGAAISALNLGYNLGVYRMLRASYGGCGVIFSLHRVIENGQPGLNPAYKLQADVLNDVLGTVRRLGWDIVSIDEMYRHLKTHRVDKSDKKLTAHRRMACFTIDDGYVDNLTVALPLFRKHGAPLAVFIATDIVERSLFYWWGCNEELTLRNERIELPHINSSLPTALCTRTYSEKMAAYQTLDQLCHKFGEALFPFLQQLYKQYGIDSERILDRDALTVSQVRELALDPLVTIGSHGVSHRRLSQMTDEDVGLDMKKGTEKLKTWSGVEVCHFAYPFGRADACGPREFAIAKQAGFKTALTTRQGNIFPKHCDYLQCLPRRVVPLSRFALRNVLYGIQAILENDLKFRTN
jgi:peptidoglycan/xylan/chitin deacetylase (PgdA/CDA1 family)